MNPLEKILKLRDAGHTTCAVVDLRGHESGPSAVDRVVQDQGFRGIATEWQELSATDAHNIATTLLHRDLAYSEEIMPLNTAADLITQLFDLVPEPHTYFTNGEWSMPADTDRDAATLQSFDPISDATLDAGVVCLGDGRAAILWIQDED